MAGTMSAAAYHETPGPDEQYADPRESEQQGDLGRILPPARGLVGGAGEHDPGREAQCPQEVEEQRHVLHPRGG